ncbi:hypothetical protein FNV43_RR24486 [Rhamnella rubrinervis]|uniref:Transposase (putative) gypsy type domain-containing protein n=1 Tax=Rhamnella rubrinervis TaxID=2594499 RepID=A0A8K0DSM7_9ROSA|nr:hypothetical protein FNV43_RR24486 [Rhamnella rubrinervis]
MIKTDIPSIFKPEDMPYLKKRYSFLENAVLSAPRDGERADSVRDGWVCFYEIAFKLGLRLPFHRIINMVLKYFNLAPGQLMPNGWRYLLGLIVLSEQLGQHIDMPIFLHFFYLKPDGEGRYAFYARRQTKLLTGAPTRPNLLSIYAALNQNARLSTNSEQNNSIDTLHAAGKNLNLLLSAKSFRAIGYWPSQQKKLGANTYQHQHDPPTEPPYQGILFSPQNSLYSHSCVECCYMPNQLTTLHLLTPIWKAKSTLQLKKPRRRKRKEKKSARKSRKSDPTQRVDPMPDKTVAISSDVIAPSTEETPPWKKQRLSSPQPTAKGKEPMVPAPKSNEPPAYKTNLGLKDGSSIRSDPKSNTPIADR